MQKTDWLRFFAFSIKKLESRLKIVLNASGCREGWLQGELFLLGQKYKLCVYSHGSGIGGFFDLSCGDGPDMLAEIKIIGALDPFKMRSRLQSDVDRVKAMNKVADRYMILITPDWDRLTTMSQYLDRCRFGQCNDMKLDGFRLRIWQISNGIRNRTRAR
jgi:hypothetical protein